MAVDGGTRARHAGAAAARRRDLRLRQQPARPGPRGRRRDAFDIGGFVPLFIRPLFCDGKGPFRWAVLSGDRTIWRRPTRRSSSSFPKTRPWHAGSVWPEAGRVPGPAGAHLLAGLRRARPGRPVVQRAGRQRAGQGADRHRPRPSRLRLGGLAQPRDRGHARRLGRHRRLADPQRHAQRGQRRHLGLGASRRRRRHRLLAPRRHGDRLPTVRRRPPSGWSAC